MRIGIDLGGTKIEIVALERVGDRTGDRAAGAVLARERIPTPRGDYDATIAAIRDLVAGVEARLGRRGTVGIGIPGAISPATGLVKNANSTWLIGRPFDRDLEVALGRPVRLANDANCFALSEAVDGAAAGASIVFGVILGTGVGGGIVVNERVLTGANAISGEWGHNPLPWPEDSERPGPACYCGRHGCIETFLSGPGLAADHQRITGIAMSAEDVVAAAAADDAAAEATLRRYEERLARALAHLVNMLDPDAIVLGGGLSGLQRLYDSVPRLWGRHIFSDHVATRLVPPVHGDSSGVRGAAWLWPPEQEGEREGGG
ncbi:MAG: ROK family protein [Oceanibaculum nanhaiense]|jgi:fructokinase|uniref:ROK family protein n=1 Tax=Oceanibaculum nanhaiense TaxID=1909734 RepID=UPI0032EB215C